VTVSSSPKYTLEKTEGAIKNNPEILEQHWAHKTQDEYIQHQTRTN
jgi:hypothetical protein